MLLLLELFMEQPRPPNQRWRVMRQLPGKSLDLPKLNPITNYLYYRYGREYTDPFIGHGIGPVPGGYGVSIVKNFC